MSTPLWKKLAQSLPTKRAPKRGRKSRSAHRNRALGYESLESRELLAVVTLQDFGVSENTGEKPQSKVWEHAGQWWAVMPKSDGTWVWKLDGTSWTPTLRVSTNDEFHADVKSSGDLTHILLYGGNGDTQLASIEYVSGPTSGYQMWSLRPVLVSVPLGSSVETATIDMDSTGRLWVAYDTSGTVDVRYADGLYSSWSAPITVASGISSDDISVITAMPNNTVGVFWSNQNTDRFGFRYHIDGASPTSWSALEIPSLETADNNMADDHVNVAVASDGTLYAAVKTSYDSSGRPAMALLVRRPNGVWENMYGVDNGGTRPIVVLNEAARKLIVAFTTSNGGGDIVYRESSMDTISFGPRQTLIDANVNNVTSTKQNFTGNVVIMASSSSNVKSALFSFDTINPNQAPQVNAGSNQTVALGATVALNGTVSDDGLPVPPGTLTTSWSRVSGPGAVTFGDAAHVDTTATFSLAGSYVLRLTASDGQRTTTDDVTITVQSPTPTNTAPTVDAGPNRTVTIGTAAVLDGTVSDDGLPASPGVVSVTWTRVSGPGAVTFANAAAVDTTAQFSAAGTYVLRLAASDGSLQSFDEMTVVVNPISDPDPEPEPDPEPNEEPVEIAFQDGLFPSITYAGTRDTRIYSGSAATNYGNATVIDIDGSPDTAALLKWDISAIPTDSIIVSAAIELNVSNSTSDNYEVYALQRAWDEMSATWQRYAANTNWAANGANGAGDHGSTSLGTFAPNSTGTYRIALNDAGVAAVQTWASDPSMNFGIILKDYAESNGADIRTSETSIAAQRPKLIISYRAAEDDMPPTNVAPMVTAGSDQTIQLPASANLNGTVSDDGLPVAPGMVTTTWTKISGPGAVTFGNPAAVDTTATFNAPGSYVLRLTAGDGDLQSFDDVTIVVAAAAPMNLAPTVDAGPNRAVTLGNAAALDGTVSDDGLPASPGTVTTTWSRVSGPGTVTFGNAATVDTTANFSAVGTYVLRLTASDGVLTSTDEMTVIVETPPNSPPVVEAGSSVVIPISSAVELNGSVSDDGLPAGGNLTISWSAAGPGIVTFGDPHSAMTTATFSQVGTYVLQLTATDGEHISTDEVTVEVGPPLNQSPIVDAGPGRTVTFGDNALLDGTVSDDGLPAAGMLTTTWAKISGPGTVMFGNVAATNTTASFSAAGTYVLRLTASDGALTNFDDVTIVVEPPAPVNQAPSVNAGNNQTIRLPAAASLDGTVSDDGLPASPGMVTTAWSRVSGPGGVVFANAAAVDTTASFSVAGTYVLRLTGTDGLLQSFDDLTVVVEAPINLPPQVNVGSNLSVTVEQSLNLNATVTDDGLPNNSLTLLWTLTAGPAAVTFGDSASANTAVEFSTAGSYVLRLTASDGSLQSFDELTVTVTEPPADDGPTDRRNPRRR